MSTFEPIWQGNEPTSQLTDNEAHWRALLHCIFHGLEDGPVFGICLSNSAAFSVRLTATTPGDKSQLMKSMLMDWNSICQKAKGKLTAMR